MVFINIIHILIAPIDSDYEYNSYHKSTSSQKINGSITEYTYKSNYIEISSKDEETSVKVGHYYSFSTYDTDNNDNNEYNYYSYCYAINDLDDFDGTIKSLENVMFDKVCENDYSYSDEDDNIPESVEMDLCLYQHVQVYNFLIQMSTLSMFVSKPTTDSSGNTIDSLGGITIDHGWGYYFSTGTWSDNTYKSLYIAVNRNPDPENHTNSYISYSYKKRIHISTTLWCY